jgi:hypothetical protein
MNLSPKAMRAIAEALEFRISAYQQQIDRLPLSENEIADLTNDTMFLESLLQDLQKTLNVPMTRASNNI